MSYFKKFSLLCAHTNTHTPLPPLSQGPSVLDVFRTLVRHLRISIESNSITSETSDNSAFQVFNVGIEDIGS